MSMEANENALKRIHIIKELSYVPDERLNEIEAFIEFILHRNKIKKAGRKKQSKSLSGIWKDKGFEKIPDLEGEIRQLRKDLGRQILEKYDRNPI